MPQAYAPCLNYTNLLRGEELVYPGGHRCYGWQCACSPQAAILLFLYR
jgi:hypothetical protein